VLVSKAMITGFNTDVYYDGRVYHVQTEDRGRDNPVLESTVYIGGTVIAKKSTPYGEYLRRGASQEAIASMLKRQHQVIIAAIKAGRVEDLVRLCSKEQSSSSGPSAAELARPSLPHRGSRSSKERPARRTTSANFAIKNARPAPEFGSIRSPEHRQKASGALRRVTESGGLNLDQVISDYIKRSSEQGKLDLKVLAPTAFIAGTQTGLSVLVLRGQAPVAEASVAVKIIGTAFKPQVYLSKTDRNGIASFNLTLPAFSAGTAAIVIEAQSNSGRGELKHLIRRS
jgi:hypothetical protein